MNRVLRLVTAVGIASIAAASCASKSDHVTEVTPRHQGEMGFPAFMAVDVKGAPKLSAPMMIMGSTKPILTGKHGLAAPALWDWDGDGKRDLIVGEFETCTKEGGGFPGGEEWGSTIRIYLNVGSDVNPAFTDEFIYARDTNGTVIEVPQWCCIGFTPQFVDLNNDGHLDMITGQYHPGDITMFAGTGKGFKPGVILEQEGNSSANSQRGEPTDIENFRYWNYSSASFGDFDDDGDQDLIVGGYALRISENIGTPEKPKFARRELLIDINGKPLVTKRLTDADKAQYAEWGAEPSPSGSGKIQHVVTDWDSDGVLDILATDEYLDSGSRAVSFFRGVKTTVGHRFEQGVDLLPAKNGVKALPGSGNRLYVDDWNKDGIKDLIIGASVVVVRDQFHDRYSWEWESITGIESAGKDAGHPPSPLLDPGEWPVYYSKEKASLAERLPGMTFTEENIRKIYDGSKAWYEGKLKEQADPDTPADKVYRHQGRVYVFLGEDRGVKAAPATVVETKVVKKKRSKRKRELPVQVALIPAVATSADDTVDLTIDIDVRKGWYIYAPTGRNAANGMVETTVRYELPEGFELAGEVSLPVHQEKGLFEIYKGEDIHLIQSVKVSANIKPGEYKITGKLRYQTCNEEMCLPPSTEEVVTTIVVK